MKCFNHIYAQIVHASPDFCGTRASVFLCGDDTQAKEVVTTLAQSLGYELIDAGPLAPARFLEALAGLIVIRAYGVGMGTDQALHLVRR